MRLESGISGIEKLGISVKYRQMASSKLTEGSSPCDLWSDRRERYALRLDISVARTDASTQSAVLTNLSLEGCCVTGSFRPGERVTLTVPGMGALSGQVCWATYGRAGVRFMRQRTEPLS